MADNFESSWQELKKQYNEIFHRMWYYYLSVSAASFRARVNQVWQIVFSPPWCAGRLSRAAVIACV